MRVLGVSLGVCSGAALVDDGRLVAAVNEERLNRRKFWMGFPRASIAQCLALAPGPVDLVAFGSTTHSPPTDVNTYRIEQLSPMERLLGVLGDLGLQRPLLGTRAGVGLYRALAGGLLTLQRPALRRGLAACGVTAPVTFLDHHACHAASAALTCGYDDALVITADQMGDGLCASVSVLEGRRLRPVREALVFHSLGIFYGYVTLMMGFRIGREGKVMGLAAHGDPRKTLPVFRKYAGFSPRSGIIENRQRGFISDYRRLCADLAPFSREDVAAGIQAHFEESLTALARYWLARTGKRRLCVAGGIFANVKVNQCLREMPEVDDVYVFANMGDGGLGAGAALLAHARRNPDGPATPLSTLYLGPAASRAEVIEALEATPGIRFHEAPDPEQEAADLLAEGKVVAWFAGRMEYGPRALGHRSILSTARDASINRWLNDKLRRTEFMPFAPTLLDEDAPLLLEGWAPHHIDARHMTSAYRATPLCRQIAPAVVHVDGTARPQVLRAQDDAGYHRLLSAYKRRTGHGIVLNTSFNMHEEPIVCTPRDALRGFLAAGLDALFIDGFRVERD